VRRRTTRATPPPKQEVSRKFIDRLAAEGDLGELEAVLATTYELELPFFEYDFLPSLLGLASLDDKRWGSRIAVERKLASMSAFVLLADSDCYRGRPRSLRIEHRPVHFGAAKLLHAKVLLLVHAKGVRLFVGSANLTSNGYRRNREVVTPLLALAPAPQGARLIREALEPMPGLFGSHWTPAASSVVQLARAKLARLASGPDDGRERFLWGGGDQPLHSQLLDLWPKGEAVERVSIVSPFWSEEAKRSPLHRLLEGLRERDALGPRPEVALFSRDDGVKPLKPVLPGTWTGLDVSEFGATAVAHAVDPLVTTTELGFVPEEGAEPRRDLHAKVVLLEGPMTSLAYVGSANFTLRGFGFVGNAHVEAGVAFVRSGREREALRRLLPGTVGEPVPLPLAAHAFKAAGEAECGQPWPSFLADVRLTVSPDDPAQLELVVQLDPAVQAPAEHELGELVRDGDQLRLERVLATHATGGRVPLDQETLGRLLRTQEVAVRWPGSPGVVAFPLNVDAAARHQLPVTPGTSNPGELHLLAYYQGRVAWPDLFPDPDERGPTAATVAMREAFGVDTSKIQSYQVREFVDALPGVRGDLEEAARSTPAGMRLALLGQVSPVALARTVVEAITAGRRTAVAGAFQLVELLLVLGEAKAFAVEPDRQEAWTVAVEAARVQVEGLLSTVRLKHHHDFARSKEFQRYESLVLARGPA
jgi:hypothetical protein